MQVYLISRPTFNAEGIGQFLKDEGRNWTPTSESIAQSICEIAGRLCYMSYGKGRKTNKEFIQNIISSRHGSVLEHANWGFIISGVSRSFTHELVRHRHLSFSQLSQRYVDESEANFVQPIVIGESGSMSGTWERAMYACKTAYRVLVSNLEEVYKDVADTTQRRKLARQAARSVMPNATETKIFVTGNARAWRHFFEVRGSSHADLEIRAVAIKILQILKEEAPDMFSDFEITAGDAGIVSAVGSI